MTTKAKPSPQTQALNTQQARVFFERLAAADPEPVGDLEYDSPFTLLVAVMLSAQATDRGVNAATRRLFACARTPQALADLGAEGIMPFIRTLGLYRTKSRHLAELSRLLLCRHDGQVPDTREALEALPGCGRKTANVVLNLAFNQPTIAVDTHIFRLSNRSRLAPGKNVRAVEEALERVIPEAFKGNAHTWLILLGRRICQARRPACYRCPVADLCLFEEKTQGQG